jgi:hypothetical protein
MPRNGAIIFADLIGKLDMLRVTGAKCERAGRYRLDRLIENRGRDAKIVDCSVSLPPTVRRKSPVVGAINALRGALIWRRCCSALDVR